MTGPFPARITRLIAVTTLCAVVPLLASCKPIDRTEWGSDPFRTAEAAARAKAFDASATARARATTQTGSTVTANPNGSTGRQPQPARITDDSGVIAGADAGSRRSSTSSVVLSTAPSTCWYLVVDGNRHKGCGNATISDTRGVRAGRATKLSGTDPITLQLLTNGQAVASGTVSGNNRYVTVRG